MIWSHLHVDSKNKTKTQQQQLNLNKIQIDDCQKWRLGVSKGAQKAQTSNYKINKPCGCEIYHGDYS